MSSREEAEYQTIADQLAKGTAPEIIEARLIAEGSDEETARLLLNRVLEETPGILKAHYTWQLYSSLGVFGLALLMALGITFLSLLGAPISFKGIARAWVAALLWMIGNGFWIVVSFWKLQVAHRLEKVRAARLQDSGGPPEVLPADDGSVPAVARQLPRSQQTTRSSPTPAPPPRSLPRDTGSKLARSAIDKRETQRLQWLGLLVVGLVAGLLTLSCCIAVPILVVISRLQQEPEASSSVSVPKEKEIDPNAPDPHEGPPPRGWVVLFRSDDPSVWNTDSRGTKYALPVRRAHSKIRYLLLKRMDTREALILPISHKQLARAAFPPEAGGYSWNGTAHLEWGGRHLGIAQSPRYKFPAPKGLIMVVNEGWDNWVGSGFGHKAFVDDTQYYCWKGQAIGHTVFEIAVTTQSLTEKEERCLLK
ncbi:MAG TPA: hypothetical protein VMG10_18910 [Gemmataceae bacterium]|nr:hypothetical protein [Gemmataceae bacterium]